MAYVMGIDGGGSTVRVVIVNSALTIIGQSQGAGANPNIIGQDAAARTIQRAITEALTDAGLSPGQVMGVGIGVAGAAQHQPWLRRVVVEAMPYAQIAMSTDYEIALVGAHGRRRGVLVLAGTGSLAYGVNSAGHSALVGGWGYLLGDEGGGYWLGMQGLRAAVRMADKRGPETSLAPAILDALHLSQPREITHWLYEAGSSRVQEVGAFAPLVLEHAEKGDRIAGEIVTTAAQELALAVRAVFYQLKEEQLPLAFTGGLLSAPNPLTELLCKLLGLEAMPKPRYSPSVGAGLLALALIGECFAGG